MCKTAPLTGLFSKVKISIACVQIQNLILAFNKVSKNHISSNKLLQALAEQTLNAKWHELQKT